jgi:hypothetical protein
VRCLKKTALAASHIEQAAPFALAHHLGHKRYSPLQAKFRGDAMTRSVISGVMSVQSLGEWTRDSYAASVAFQYIELAAGDCVRDFLNIGSQPIVAYRASAGLARLGHGSIVSELARSSQITYVLGPFHFRKLPYLRGPQGFTIVGC